MNQINDRANLIERLIGLERETIQLRVQLNMLPKETGKSCQECHTSDVYCSDEWHHLDGNDSNNMHGNIAVICPCCHSHIALSRFTPEDIYRFKMAGMNNAEIGRLLLLSRERIRQLAQRSTPEQKIINIAKIAYKENKTVDEQKELDAYIGKLEKLQHDREIHSPDHYNYVIDKEFGDKYPVSVRNRVTDRRTIKKRILKQLLLIAKKEAHHEGTNTKER